jgi:putative ABC transport system permease protein
MRSILEDARHALRLAAKNPGFAALAVITLALGIGANTAVFSVVDDVMLRPLDYPEPERLVRVFTTRPEVGWSRMTVSFPDFNDWSERNTSFSHMGIYWGIARNYTGGDRPERLITIQGSTGLLPALGFTPALGRAFTAEEAELGAEPVVLLTDSFWRRSLGADPTVVGQTLELDGVATTVIGVLPPELERAWTRLDLVSPLAFDEQRFGRGWRAFRVFARLAPGVSLEQARAEMDVIATAVGQEEPTSAAYGVSVVPIDEVVVGSDARAVLFVLVAAVGFVLLIACANVANLLLARGTARRREFAVRAALGAGRWRMVRQMITESLVLALSGGALGVILAHWGVEILVGGLSDVVARSQEVAIDPRVLFFTFSLSILTALMFGLVPALQGSASSVTESLKRSAPGTTAGSRSRTWRDALVVTQVALALALLVGTGLMIESLSSLRSIEPGFDSEGVLAVQVQLPRDRYDTDPAQAAFFRDAVERVGAVPGVTAAAAVSALPLVGDDGNSAIQVEGFVGPETNGMIFVGDVVVTPGYFRMLHVPLLRGRTFTARDHADAPGVVVVNEQMTRMIWPGEDPIGKRLKFGDDPNRPWLTVVGVVGDVRQVSLFEGPRAEAYRPASQFPLTSMALLVRTPGEPLASTRSVQEAIWEVDPDLALFGVRTLKQVEASNSRGTASITWLLSAFAGTALVLALAGLYGVMSYLVSRRTREVALRMALGAKTRDLLRLVLRRALLLTLLGVVGGVLIALSLAGALESLVFGVSPTDTTTFVVVAALLVVVALGASYVPALRATRVDPATALRQE